MIQTNHDQSLLKHMQNKITSLMLALSEKYSSDDSNDTLVVHPSLFDLIEDNSSESGYSSKQVSSTSNDCSDSDWQLSQIKNAHAISGESASDIVSRVTSNHDAHHQCRPNLNYITDSLSQDSNDQKSSTKGGSESESKDNSEDEDNESGVCIF
jgi:hypothetical protein